MTEELPDNEITLAPMTAADIHRVYELEVMCFSSPWDIEDYLGELLNPSSYYQVARLGGEIVGFAGMWAIGDEAHIVTIAVDTAYRRRGIGRRLVAALLTECRARGGHRVTLEVRITNTPAQELYRSFGFQTIARRRDYYPDNGEDALVMGKEV